MNIEIQTYNEQKTETDQEICDLLANTINQELEEAENKIWHAHPVWFLEGNPMGLQEYCLNGSVFSRRLSRSRIMRNLFWMRRTMSLYPSCLMLSEPVFCSSATIVRISGMDSRTIFCSSFNRRFSIARILLSAHCGYSGSIFDFFVIEERPVMPGPLFFTGISTSLSFWEPSSLCRHQKDPASPP